MSEETSLTIILTTLILTIGGCWGYSSHEQHSLSIEREKTRQMVIQAKIDSMKIVHNLYDNDGTNKDEVRQDKK